MIVFDPNHVIDAPTGFGRCYLVKFGNALVQNRLVVPVVQPLKDQLSTALAQVKALQVQQSW
jgi:ribosomal protein L9